jgi:hypothetical protein
MSEHRKSDGEAIRAERLRRREERRRRQAQTKRPLRKSSHGKNYRTSVIELTEGEQDISRRWFA